MTATASTNRLMNSIRSRVPGALDAQIQAEMFEVLDEFFQFTNVWQELIPVSIQANVLNYDVAPTGVASIIRLLLVQVAGTNPNPKLCTPIAATMEVPGCLQLAQPITNLPTTPYTFNVTVSETCIDPTTSDGYPIIPRWIMDRYHKDFVDGVVGRLMSQPAKPYSNQTLSVYHLRRWRNAMSGTRIEVNRQNTYGAQAWMFPQQFRTIPRHGAGGYFGNWPV